jgi:PKD repeat protein
VTGLTVGQLYYFAVTAYDASTESTKSNEVNPTIAAAPVATFSATPTSGPAPLAVTFTDASTGSITTRVWDFGDGSTSTLLQPSHTYAAAGTYTAKFTVTGPGGSTSATKTITVAAPPVAPPVAAFSATPTSGRLPLKVAFTDASTGSITTWAWTFGDGGTSTVRQLTHTYTAPGTYTAKLTVTGPGGSVTMTKTGYITVAPALVEVGNLTVDYVWKRITFRQVFVDPIVVATPLSSNDFAPATIRLRNVGPTGFDIRVEEWAYLDGVHLPETVSYLAMERGPHTLGTGIRVEAGRLATNLVSKTTWAAVSFQQGFQVAPVVLTAVTSVNEADAVITRVKGRTAQGFQVRMQEQLNNVQSHATESIDYIAWEPSAGTVDGLLFEVKTTPDVVTDQVYTLQFTESFLTPPMFLAGMQTTDGADPATLRWDNKTQSQVAIEVQEEASRTHGLNHTTEVVGYMATPSKVLNFSAYNSIG